MKNKFYDIFRLGIELEMEIPEESYRKAMDNNDLSYDATILKFVTDGSLRTTRDNTQVTELITRRPMEKKQDEEDFISQMKHVLGEFDSSTKQKIFSHYNKTASTHFHWSLKNESEDMLWIFDCIDFEKFFFKKYLKTFKSEKFIDRLSNKYCKVPYIGTETKDYRMKYAIENLNKITIKKYQEEREICTGRYRWLNMQSVEEHTGAEIRIFPFLQTYDGVKLIIKFMQELLIEYYELPETKEKIELMKIYNESIKEYGIKDKNLNKMKRMIYEYITQSTGRYSGEICLMLGSWAKKQPSILIKNNDNNIPF